MTSPRMYASGKRKKPPSGMTGPIATHLDAPMLDRISTTAMTASMMPKCGEPIEANFGAAGAGKVLAEVMGIPFVVVRSAARTRNGEHAGRPAVLALDGAGDTGRRNRLHSRTRRCGHGGLAAGRGFAGNAPGRRKYTATRRVTGEFEDEALTASRPRPYRREASMRSLSSSLPPSPGRAAAPSPRPAAAQAWPCSWSRCVDFLFFRAKM